MVIKVVCFSYYGTLAEGHKLWVMVYLCVFRLPEDAGILTD